MEPEGKRGVYSIARSMLPHHFLRRANTTASDEYDIEQHLNMNMFEEEDTKDGFNEDLVIDIDQFNMDLFSPQQGIQVKQESPQIKLQSPLAFMPQPPPSLVQSPQVKVQPNSPQITTPQTSDASTPKKRKNETGLAQYKFGRTTPIQYPPSIEGPLNCSVPSYLPDFNPLTWDQMANHTSHKLLVQDLPRRSRVETQINLSMFVYPPPAQTLVHLPTDTISKPKLQLRQGFEPDPEVLMLETVVVCQSDPLKYVNICSGCMNRERKRASRKKVRVAIDEAHWNCDRDRRAIVFNCKEVVELSPITSSGGVIGRRLDLPMRIACYCRHHGEEIGFVAYISLRDHTGRVIAQTKTTPIMITDDHKVFGDSELSQVVPSAAAATPAAPRLSSDSQSRASFSDASSMMAARMSSESHSRTSFSDISRHTSPPSEPMDLDTRTSKKRKSSTSDIPFPASSTTSLQKMGSVSEASSVLDTDLFTVPSSATDFSSSYTNMAGLVSGSESTGEEDLNIPTVKRLIPSQGSIRGGIEITLLGHGFHDGLAVKFGDNYASTQCWSETTIVAQLPATEVAGPVVVSFAGVAVKNPQLFTYIDDTDRQLIELALQVVGLKMNGKLEDAKDIARRLIGGGGVSVNGVDGVMGASSSQSSDYTQRQMRLESELIKLLTCCDSFNVHSNNNGVNLTNNKRQSMLHLAAGLGLCRLVTFLTSRGGFLNSQDDSGFTPLHYAALRGKLDVVAYLVSQNVNLFVESKSGHYALDIAVEEIRSYLMDLMYSGGVAAEPTVSGSETEVPDSSKRVTRRHRRRGTRGRRRGIAQYMYDLNNAVWSSNMGDLYHFIRSPFRATPTVVSEPEPSTSSPTAEHAPPKYEDIFPEGSKVPEIDYSSSVIEESSASVTNVSWDRKDQIAVAATPSNTPTDGTGGEAIVQMSEEEVMEAWKSKRKLLHQDVMFFLFWLPIFVILMYWAYWTARSYLVEYFPSLSWDSQSAKQTFLDYSLHVIIPKKHMHKVKFLRNLQLTE